MKRDNTINRSLNNPFNLAGRFVEDIWFDLKHIRYGWDPHRRDYNDLPPRNEFTEDDIVAFFEQLSYLTQDPVEQSVNRKDIDKRFVFYVFDSGRKLKMVVDFMKNSSTIVVTVH